MTKEQYEILLAALADKIKAQESEITLQAAQISMLERKIKEAESLKDGREKTAKLEIR